MIVHKLNEALMKLHELKFRRDMTLLKDMRSEVLGIRNDDNKVDHFMLEGFFQILDKLGVLHEWGVTSGSILIDGYFDEVPVSDFMKNSNKPKQCYVIHTRYKLNDSTSKAQATLFYGGVAYGFADYINVEAHGSIGFSSLVKKDERKKRLGFIEPYIIRAYKLNLKDAEIIAKNIEEPTEKYKQFYSSLKKTKENGLTKYDKDDILSKLKSAVPNAPRLQVTNMNELPPPLYTSVNKALDFLSSIGIHFTTSSITITGHEAEFGVGMRDKWSSSGKSIGINKTKDNSWDVEIDVYGINMRDESQLIEILIHELGHSIEDFSSRYRQKLEKFITGREKAKIFFRTNRYMNRIYGTKKRATNSEFTSVGLELLYSKPDEFAMQDRMAFQFLVDNLILNK